MDFDQKHFDDESSLLMYLSDELEAAQRAALDARLRKDPRLAAELADLRSFDSQMKTSVALLDASMPTAGLSTSAMKRIARQIAQWQVNRAIALPAAQTHVLRWLSVGAVAASLVGAMIWWSAPPQATTKQMVAAATPEPAQEWIASDQSLALAETEKELNDLAALRTFNE